MTGHQRHHASPTAEWTSGTRCLLGTADRKDLRRYDKVTRGQNWPKHNLFMVCCGPLPAHPHLSSLWLTDGSHLIFLLVVQKGLPESLVFTFHSIHLHYIRPAAAHIFCFKAAAEDQHDVTEQWGTCAWNLIRIMITITAVITFIRYLTGICGGQRPALLQGGSDFSAPWPWTPRLGLVLYSWQTVRILSILEKVTASHSWKMTLKWNYSISPLGSTDLWFCMLSHGTLDANAYDSKHGSK